MERSDEGEEGLEREVSRGQAFVGKGGRRSEVK